MKWSRITHLQKTILTFAARPFFEYEKFDKVSAKIRKTET